MSSSDIHRRSVAYDDNSEQIFFSSDMTGSYVFICRLNKDTGSKNYCAKYDGDAADYTIFLLMAGDYLLYVGSS